MLRRFAARIHELTLIELGLLIAGLIMCVVVVVLSARAIATPLVTLRAAVEKLLAGVATDVPAIDRRDEIGALARALARIHGESVIATRIKSALDTCQTNVMVADANLDITYVNEMVVRMLRAAQSDIRKDLPQFDVDRLIGTNIDDFHKNPTHQRSMLASLTSAYKTQIKVGGAPLG